MRLGLNLRVSLIVVPLVAAMLALALAPIRSYLRLRAAMDDVRRELSYVLAVCRLEHRVRALDGSPPNDHPPAPGGARGGAEDPGGGFPPPDRSQIDGNLALRQALDSLLATSAQLAVVPPLDGLEADAKSLRQEVAGAISVCRYARQAQRLLGEYRRYAHFGDPPEDLTAAEREFDHAYWVWQAQVEGGDGERVPFAGTGLTGVEAHYRLIKDAVRRVTGLDPALARPQAARIYDSELAPIEGESLPRVLGAAFDAHDDRVSALLDSIARQSSLGGAAAGLVALLAFALALLCPWLISTWIVRPVLALDRATRELATGGSGGPVSVRAGSEIADLAASFNRMSERLAERTRELDEERARERLRHAERLASVGILAAGLAHQINNPVNNILLTAEHALGERGPEAPERWREALAASAEEARRCERIVRGLVAFARGEQGRLWREDAHQLVRRACELTADAADRREATVAFEPGGEPAPILANPIALEQALVNVLRNAIESGSRAHVAVRTRRVGPAVRIEIRDDGRGMDRTAVGRLFDPFYTTRADEGGIGLGLSVAHRIISDHGGEIRVESRPGEGTTVTVDLPLDHDDALDR